MIFSEFLLIWYKSNITLSIPGVHMYYLYYLCTACSMHYKNDLLLSILLHLINYWVVKGLEDSIYFQRFFYIFQGLQLSTLNVILKKYYQLCTQYMKRFKWKYIFRQCPLDINQRKLFTHFQGRKLSKRPCTFFGSKKWYFQNTVWVSLIDIVCYMSLYNVNIIGVT